MGARGIGGMGECVETLQVGRFDLSHVDCGKKDKVLLLRNCVEPKLGLHVFNAAFKDKQKVINDFHVTPPKASEAKEGKV
jgi:hypothetical protein